jgi:uncharacterized membrane protein YbhN (UPF0104 family)
LLKDLGNANLLWFVPTTLVSFCIWFFGENLLFTRLFSHFHAQTGYVELLPATGAAYFLRLINALVSDGALILFLHRRKNVPWLAASVTFLFLGFIDGYVFSFLAVVSGLRTARMRTYLELGAIRLGIFLPDAAIVYIAMRAFRIDVPFLIVLAVLPAIIAAGGIPLTPTGLGPMQAVAVYEFAQYATTSGVLATFLALGVALLVYRLPLGLGSAGACARIILRSGESPGAPDAQGVGRRQDDNEATPP